MYVLRKLSQLLTWLSIRLAVATVAAVSATGFGLLAAPSAHAWLDATIVEIDQSAITPLPTR